MANNLVLVIGGTGAQGAPVVAHLVKDGKYRVRALTRDAGNSRAQSLVALGNVELFQGSLTNEADLAKAFHGVDLAFVNLDTFTLGEMAEGYWAMRIFEFAVRSGTVRHFVWGSLDYVSQKMGYDPKYRCVHYDSKGRVTQWLRGQPPGIIWSALSSGPYMDALFQIFRPQVTADGTYVFCAPLGDGAMPMIALDDLGFYARWIFDNPSKSAGLDLEIATQDVTWPEIAETFTRVTGKPAKAVDVPLEDFMRNYSKEVTIGPQGITWYDNFTAWWNLYRDRVFKRDYKKLYAIHPNHLTLETWMIKNKYDGTPRDLLKDADEQLSFIKRNLAPAE